MLEFLIDSLNTKTLTMLFAAVAAVATVLTLAMPLVFADPLGKRMKAVALEREKIRQRERERMAQAQQKVNLRPSAKQSIQAIVDRFNLKKWVGQEEARLKLVQAGYRGQAPYITYLFFRMVTPAAMAVLAAPLSSATRLPMMPKSRKSAACLACSTYLVPPTRSSCRPSRSVQSGSSTSAM
jgi:tight adherence protein C